MKELKKNMKKVCMIVPNKMVKGGIASVVNGYRGSILEKDYKIIYVESYKDGNKFTKLLKAIKGYLQFIKVLIFNRPDLVHIHSSFGPSFYRKLPFIYLASWSRIPIVNHIHGADFNEFYVNASVKKKKIIRKVYSKCNKLIALSEEWKENLSQIVSKDKIVIIENYSILHEDALKERLNRPCNNQILFLGELGKRKGCYDIPFVIELVAKVVPNVKFVLCGAGNKDDEALIKNMIIEKNIENNVVFPGWIRGEEKDKILRESDVFFLPSYNEGMPMSILDAMGYGLPVVSTNVGGIPRIVHNGKNGSYCSAGDISKLSLGIIMLLKNNEDLKKASKESFMIVREKYSLVNHLNRIKALYESLF